MCPKHVESNVTSIGRGGAVAEFVEDSVLLCGGRDKQNRVMGNCMAYNPMNNHWESHSELIDMREEASSVTGKFRFKKFEFPAKKVHFPNLKFIYSEKTTKFCEISTAL